VGSCRALAGMIAGGTGITPMYQIIKEILRNPEDATKVSLLFGNLTIHDIILKDELDDLVRQHPTQLYVHYVLDSAPEGWMGSTGYITSALIQEHCPAPSDDSMLLFCGPRPMTKSLEATAQNIGYSVGQYHVF
jgi:cytochrome-b5 reductase